MRCNFTNVLNISRDATFTCKRSVLITSQLLYHSSDIWFGRMFVIGSVACIGLIQVSDIDSGVSLDTAAYEADEECAVQAPPRCLGLAYDSITSSHRLFHRL